VLKVLSSVAASVTYDVTSNFSDIKVKVQGQNQHTKKSSTCNSSAMLLRCLHQILQSDNLVISASKVTSNKIQDGRLGEVCTL